jgi:hypothetical protein
MMCLPRYRAIRRNNKRKSMKVVHHLHAGIVTNRDGLRDGLPCLDIRKCDWHR